MVGSIGGTRTNTRDFQQKHQTQIWMKLQNGTSEEAIATGGNEFTETVWNRMLEHVDDYLADVKEEQKLRFAKRDKEQAEKEQLQKRLDAKKQEEKLQNSEKIKEILIERSGAALDVPYGYLAKDGLINYNGVTFVCDEQRNAICLGDMSNQKEVLTIPLEKGGCLKVNRENISELSKAISMFSPEDIRRILQAVATDTKCQQMQQEMEETAFSISGSVVVASKDNSADVVTAEQIAQLFRDTE